MLKQTNDYLPLKFIHIIAKNDDQGITFWSILWRLILGIVILFVIASIVLPNFLSCKSTSRISEGRSFLQMLIRSQKVYFQENNKFASSIEELDITPPKLRYYDFEILKNGVIFFKGRNKDTNRTPDMVGRVSYDVETKTYNDVTCEAIKSTISNPSQAILNAGKVRDNKLSCSFNGVREEYNSSTKKLETEKQLKIQPQQK